MSTPDFTPDGVPVNLHDPKGCDHHWQPVSLVFDPVYRGALAIPDTEDTSIGRTFLVCLRCAQHTYIRTSFTTWQIEGAEHRGFTYDSSSTAPYSTDGGETWQRERPDVGTKAGVSFLADLGRSVDDIDSEQSRRMLAANPADEA